MTDKRIIEALEKIHESTVKLVRGTKYDYDKSRHKELKKKSRRILRLMDELNGKWWLL